MVKPGSSLLAFCTLCTLHTVQWYIGVSKVQIFDLQDLQCASDSELDSFMIKPLPFVHCAQKYIHITDSAHWTLFLWWEGYKMFLVLLSLAIFDLQDVQCASDSKLETDSYMVEPGSTILSFCTLCTKIHV